MDNALTQAVLATLAYSDVFSYPLSLGEIGQSLVGKRRFTKEEVQKAVNELVRTGIVRQVGTNKKYFALERDVQLVDREERKQISVKKLERVKWLLKIVALLPTVLLVGVSGSVARNNAGEHDDIDLFIIVRSGTLWMTRLLLVIFASSSGFLRRAHDLDVANKLCLNMLIDSQHLAVPLGERDIFSAFEVVQMKPLFMKGDIYRQFLQENKWLGKFLANSISGGTRQEARDRKKWVFEKFILHLASYILLPLEYLAQVLQLWYMRKHRTTEIVTAGYVRFHPMDARKWILPKYRLRFQEVVRDLNKKVKTSRASHP